MLTNFRWEDGQKVNVLDVEDFTDDVIFVSGKKCFSIQCIFVIMKSFFSVVMCLPEPSSTPTTQSSA